MPNCSFKSRTKIAACTDPQSKRYALGKVHVCPDLVAGVWLTSTDGRIAAMVHDEDGEADGVYLAPSEIVKRKNAKVILDGGLWEDGKTILKDVPAEDLSGGRFPRVDEIVPALPTAEDAFTVTIDAAYLKALADAISSDDQLTLFIDPQAMDSEGVAFIPAVGNEGIGVFSTVANKDTKAERGERYANQADRYRQAKKAARGEG